MCVCVCAPACRSSISLQGQAAHDCTKEGGAPPSPSHHVLEAHALQPGLWPGGPPYHSPLSSDGVRQPEALVT